MLLVGFRFNDNVASNNDVKKPPAPFLSEKYSPRAVIPTFSEGSKFKYKAEPHHDSVEPTSGFTDFTVPS